MSQLSLEPLHRFHPYCARFPSEIVEAALERYTKPGDSIFDPFCGSGTTLVAGLAHQRRVVGSDIDALAVLLSEVKCAPLAAERYAAWRDQFAARLVEDFAMLSRAWKPRPAPRPGSIWPIGALKLPVPKFPEVRYWFPSQVIAALSTISEAAHQCQEPHYERLALLSLSASIIAKWPQTLSYAMDIDHTRPHRRLQRFTLDRVLTTYLRRLDRSIACLSRLHDVYREAGVFRACQSPPGAVYQHDARAPLPEIPDASQALVITSPPYFNAVDYPRAHRLSLCWMQGYAPAAPASRRPYIGLRHAAEFDALAWLQAHPTVRRQLPVALLHHGALTRRLCAFFADLEAVLIQAWRVLKPGGHALFVIANNVIKGHRLESHAVLAGLARESGFEVVETTSRSIARLHRRFPVGPFGFDGPMTHEYLVVLRKPMALLYGHVPPPGRSQPPSRPHPEPARDRPHPSPLPGGEGAATSAGSGSNRQRHTSPCQRRERGNKRWPPRIGGTDMPPDFASSQVLSCHRRLCAGDRTASDDLAALLLTPLHERISRQFSRADEHLCSQAVADALLDYCAEPQRFDEARGVPLARFLLLASRRNMLNLLRGESRRKAREERAAQMQAESSVELDPVVGNLLQQEENAQLRQREEELMRLLPDPKDRQILALRLQGERHTEAFAAVLGISHLSPEEQRRAVKRAKDRIDKIMRRQGGDR
jgi:DNA modification methylase